MPIKDTIVALSTPPGRSGIGILRLSGQLSLDIARALVRNPSFVPEPQKVRLTTIHDPATGDIVDRALITYFKAPHSFTGEDIIELSCHGSPVLLRNMLDIILSLNARLAEPGEFTLRALGHGRLNLSQAEAIRDLINAKTKAAVHQAQRQLGGELSRQLQPLKDILVEVIVPLESALEFVEDDLPEVLIDEIRSKLSTLGTRIAQLGDTFKSGRLLRDGMKVVLIGKPNVGKSSVFNQLLVQDRAIVTAVAGTTRDSLSEGISLSGIPILLTDTAGLRTSEDPIENLGVERTRTAIADADLIIYLIDRSQSLTSEDSAVFEAVRQNPHIIALNKSDLPPFPQSAYAPTSEETIAVVNISAKLGTGLDDLRAAIIHPFISHNISSDGLLVTDARHFDLLKRTGDSLRSSHELLGDRVSEELVLVGLYDALRCLGEITGETTPDDVLSAIFATFCIGK